METSQTHEEHIQQLTAMIAQLDEMRRAYSSPMSALARSARNAVEALQQAMKLPPSAPKRKLARKPKLARNWLAWRRQRLTRLAQAKPERKVLAAELESALDAYDVMFATLRRDEVVPVLIEQYEALERQLAIQHEEEVKAG